MTDAADDAPSDEEQLDRAEDLLDEASEFLDRAEQRRDMADTRDLDEAVARAREGLALASADAELELELRAVLSGALMKRAQARLHAVAAGDTALRGAVRADLDEAIGHAETELATAPAGDPATAPLLADLTFACLWRVQVDDEQSPSHVDRLVRHAQEAWPLLDPEHEDWPTVGYCLATGLYDQVFRPRADYPAHLVDALIDVLSEITPKLGDGSDERLLAEVMLASGLVGRGQETRNTADLTTARPLILSAAAALRHGDPAHAYTSKELARTVSVLADQGLLSDHLDLVIDAMRSAVANPVGDPAQDAGTRSYLAGVLRIRAFRDGSRDLRDSADAREAIALLQASYDKAPPGSAERGTARWDIGAALLTRYFQTGVREDLDAARFYLEPFRDTAAGGPIEALRGSVDHLEATVSYTMGQLSLARAVDGDLAAFDEAISCFQTALEHWPDPHPLAARTRSELATARLLRAARAPTPDVTGLRDAVRGMRAATDAVAASEATTPVALLQAAGALAAAGYVAEDATIMREAIARLSRARDQLGPGYGERPRFTGLLGLVSAHLYEMTGSRDDLRSAAAWLEEAHAELDRHPGHPRHGDMLSALARLRHVSGDDRRAIEAGLALLRVRVRDVLLQTGTRRGLASARAAAANGLRVARLSLKAGLPARAVEALELGRGLVLHSATSVAELPELLAARGRDDLAREWRAEAEGPWDSAVSEPGGADGGTEALSALLEAGGLIVPGDLRERTLDALADVAADRLLAAPGPSEIGAALARAGVDALVYLLLADEEQAADGGPAVRALLVPAGDGGQTRELPLQGLAAGTLLDDCAAAHAGLLAAGPDEDATERAREQLAAALGQLCAWAGAAVIDPLLKAVPSGLPQLVIVPTGPLSLVPWHAARCADDGGGWSYACTRAVFTYAASGRQYVEVSRRPKLPPGQSPVIVADPTSTLPGAEEEARAIRDNFYPRARCLGPGTDADGRGEPADVLAVLPSATSAGASVLHVAGHGNVETGSPDRSYLELADGRPLTVSAILRQAAGRDPAAAGGLVCLAACRTDLAAEDYDEALTLATAFLAGGAAGVVGARWEIPDLPSSALMFMFHYFLVKRGLPESEALRQAQLWMLGPERAMPADTEMPEQIAAWAGLSVFAELTSWAGITHQGQ